MMPWHLITVRTSTETQATIVTQYWIWRWHFYLGREVEELWSEVLSVSIKQKSFLSNSLIWQKNHVSECETEMQKSGKLRTVGVSGVFLPARKPLPFWKLEMVWEFVRLVLQLGGWVCGLSGMCRMRLISFPTWSWRRGPKKSVIEIGWTCELSSGNKPWLEFRF